MRTITVLEPKKDDMAMLVSFYEDGKLAKWEIFSDTKDIQEATSAFFFGPRT